MKNKQLNYVIITLLLLFICLWACKSLDSPQSGEKTPEAGSIMSSESEMASDTDDFVITEEIYNKTFEEIDAVIEQLNASIANKSFQAWKGFLSPSYVSAKSDASYLKELSDQPKLMSQGVVLETLYDYFIYVIVPSRAKLKLDEIVFQNKSHVKAYTIINGQKLILYYLEYIDNQWKIANW
ncbi:MAG: hypothetical protein JXR70_05240 [Spirochaetales bacterium]|nr:hypothetical protein [Spirochaetales bacterium]